MADQDRCQVCEYKSGEGFIIICNNRAHFGMAMRAEAICDYFERYVPPAIGKVKRIVVADKVHGEDK